MRGFKKFPRLKENNQRFFYEDLHKLKFFVDKKTKRLLRYVIIFGNKSVSFTALTFSTVQSSLPTLTVLESFMSVSEVLEPSNGQERWTNSGKLSCQKIRKNNYIILK